MICHGCRGEKTRMFLSLGSTPLANAFLREEQLQMPESSYPLEVYYCDNCGMVQIGYIVPPEILFPEDYPYITSGSQTMKAHFAELVDSIVREHHPSKEGIIVDIGSNDGTLLHNFLKYDYKVLGIEPATNVARLAIANGVDTISVFFGEESAKRVRDERGQASLILGTNVFAHVADLDSVLRGVTHLLADDGMFVIEFPYLVDMAEKMEFDTIYHEHLRYFAVRPLVVLFERFGMGIVDVKRTNVHGGSMVVYTQKGSDSSAPSVVQAIELEKKAKLDSFKTYKSFGKSVARLKTQLRELLQQLKSEGATIAGYGAPAKGNTLLNYCEIGTDVLDYIVDSTPFKQGHFTPGMHIPVVAEYYFHANPPDYALLLAWNFEEEILRKEEQFQQNGGKFIRPIPKPTIIQYSQVDVSA